MPHTHTESICSASWGFSAQEPGPPCWLSATHQFLFQTTLADLVHSVPLSKMTKVMFLFFFFLFRWISDLHFIFLVRSKRTFYSTYDWFWRKIVFLCIGRYDLDFILGQGFLCTIKYIPCWCVEHYFVYFSSDVIQMYIVYTIHIYMSCLK